MSLVIQTLFRGGQCRHSGNECWRLRLRLCVYVCACVFVCVSALKTTSLPSKCILTHTQSQSPELYAVSLWDCTTWEPLNTVCSYQRTTFSGGEKKRCLGVTGKTVTDMAGSYPSPCVYLCASHFLSNTDALGGTRRACKYTHTQITHDEKEQC